MYQINKIAFTITLIWGLGIKGMSVVYLAESLRYLVVSCWKKGDVVQRELDREHIVRINDLTGSSRSLPVNINRK